MNGGIELELTWLECLIYGLLSGLAELLPISSIAHQSLLLKLMGKHDDPYFRIAAILGVVIALLIACYPAFSRMRRERLIASTPKGKRHRQPDFNILMERRVFRTAAITMMICYLLYRLVLPWRNRLWIVALMLFVNGFINFIPQRLPSANKTAQSLSGLDGVLIGLLGGAGVFPGISRVGGLLSMAQMRGTETKYGLELAMLCSIPGLVLLAILSVLTTSATMVLTGAAILCYLLTALASFAGAWLGIVLMRYLSVKMGYGAFAYYSWGAALFALFIYLI